MTALDYPFIPGRTYRTRDPEVTFVAGRIVRSCGLIFGTEIHYWTGFVGPSHRLLNGRVSVDKESPLDLVAE